MKKNLILPVISIAVYITVYLLLFSPGRPMIDFDISLGESLPEGIISPVEFDVPLPDDEYQLRKEDAAALVPVYLERDFSVFPDLSEEVFTYLSQQLDDSLFVDGVLGKLSGMYEKGVFDLAHVRQVYSGDEAVFLTDSSESLIALTSLHHLEEVRNDLSLTLGGGGVSRSVIGASVVLLLPNVITNEPARNTAIDVAVEMVSSVDTILYPGDTLIPPGGVVTGSTLRILKALRESDSELSSTQRMKYLAGRALLMAGLALMALIYVSDQMKRTWRERNRLLLLGVIWLASLAATGLVWLLIRGAYSSPYGSLVTFGSALTSIFFNRKHALFFSMLFALALGGAHPYPFTFVLITFVSGSLAGYFVWDLRRRSSVPRSISAAAVGSILAWAAMALLSSGSEGNVWWSSVIELVIAPVIGVGAATSVLLPLEKAFGVYTVLAIDEVKDRHHPLLEKLSERAMGTWQHSQAVADLASEAARAIGADADLAEAGGLFHDVGKLKAPEFFVENQSPDEGNPHESMGAEESAKVIIAHVIDGVELARKHNLPDSLIRVIEQHHGDSTTRYFLEKARKLAENPDDIDISLFSYNGPRPESTEAAIVMLADSVSSAVQALPETSPEAVSSTVKRIIEEKDVEGQFDECHVTRANLRKIGETFLSVLRGRYHERVTDYPHGAEESDNRSDPR